jgi:hypothetical protein
VCHITCPYCVQSSEIPIVNSLLSVIVIEDTNLHLSGKILYLFCLLQVGHNIYILCHQLAQHNKELAALLKPSENSSDPKMNQALKYYASHTSQIEVSVFGGGV